MLKIEGHTVTTDAMGCQKEIAKVIDDGGGNSLQKLDYPRLYLIFKVDHSPG